MSLDLKFSLQLQIVFPTLKTISLLYKSGETNVYLLSLHDSQLILKQWFIGDGYQTEKCILNQLNHPHIIKIKHSFDDWQALVFDYYPWGDCFQNQTIIIEKFTPHLIYFVYQTLLYLHEHKIIYGDLKPENILVKHISDTDIEFILIDFGMSRNFSSQIVTQGTSDYFPPEYIRKIPSNYKVDSWMLGIFIYELLTCEYPFKNYDEILHRPVKYPSYFSDQVKDLLGKLLKKSAYWRTSLMDLKNHPFWSICQDKMRLIKK